MQKNCVKTCQFKNSDSKTTRSKISLVTINDNRFIDHDDIESEINLNKDYKCIFYKLKKLIKI